MEKEILVKNEEGTIELGYRLGKLLKPGSILTLSGDLGAGKTTFTKGIGKGLGIVKIINSPTFTILKQYQGNLRLSHFDAYRLEGQDDDLGFEEIFNSDDVCVIEWANYIVDILPKERLEISIYKIDEETRRFVFHAIGSQYQVLIEEL